MPRNECDDVNDAFWTASENKESKKNSGRKVVDEDERLRRKVEVAELVAEEEKMISGLEKVYLQDTNQKGNAGREKGGEIDPSLGHSLIIQAKKALQNRNANRNQRKSRRKKAKDKAEQRNAVAEAAARRKTEVVNETLHENANHVTFFKRTMTISSTIEDEKEENDLEHDGQHGISDSEEDSSVSNSSQSPTTVAVDACDFVPQLTLDKSDGGYSHSRGKMSKRQGKLREKGRRGKANASAVQFDIPIDSISSTTTQTKKQAKAAAKARYEIFEKRVLPGLVAAQPLMKIKQHREHARELWLRSPENPDHPNHKLFLAHSEIQM